SVICSNRSLQVQIHFAVDKVDESRESVLYGKDSTTLFEFKLGVFVGTAAAGQSGTCSRVKDTTDRRTSTPEAPKRCNEVMASEGLKRPRSNDGGDESGTVSSNSGDDLLDRKCGFCNLGHNEGLE
ncbi:unnamed protein product, partial [Ectocarpus sp. 12 AP-2014]